MIESMSAAAILGECPVWSEAEQVLFWTDIDGRKLHRLDPSTGDSQTHEMSGRVGSFVLTETPGLLLCAIEHELVWFDWASEGETPWITVEDPDLGNRLNDGRCDSAGRYIVGTMWPDSRSGQATGHLYQIDSTGSVSILESNVGVPNGLVFDDERRRMYWTDTHTQLVHVWDYDVDSGERSNKRLFYDFTDDPGFPDGACLDADGCYWSAAVYGWELVRITPDGLVDRRIELPVQKPSMPAFGGADLQTLFVTTIGAGGSLPSENAKDGFESGALLAVDAGVTGLPEPVVADQRSDLLA